MMSVCTLMCLIFQNSISDIIPESNPSFLSKVMVVQRTENLLPSANFSLLACVSMMLIKENEKNTVNKLQVLESTLDRYGMIHKK